MSHFQCRKGHTITSKDGGVCPVCGGGVYTMDGKTRSELRNEERQEQARQDAGVDPEEGGGNE